MQNTTQPDKGKEILTHAATQMDLEDIMVSEVSQSRPRTQTDTV